MPSDKKKKRRSKRRRKSERAKKIKEAKIDKKETISKKNDKINKDLEEQKELMKKMGLPCAFDSTKGKEVPEANAYAVRLRSKRRYRQYMNNKGGFNRNLAPSY